jgi:hypothetical protein
LAARGFDFLQSTARQCSCHARSYIPGCLLLSGAKRPLEARSKKCYIVASIKDAVV